MNNRQNMMKYRPGDIAYIVSNNKWVRKVEIVGVSYGLITVHILERNSYIRLRENRLFPTEEAAKASLPKKGTSDPINQRNDKKKELFRKYAGKYRLVTFINGKTDLSDEYINGWKDKSTYKIFEIMADGKCILKYHTSLGDKEYRYFLDPEKMEAWTKKELPSGFPLYRGGPVKSPEEAVRAEEMGADYLSAGPVSVGENGSFSNEPASITPEELKKICRAVKIPVFAETSLNPADVSVLSESGIAGILAPAPLSAGRITEETARLSDAVHRLRGAAEIKAAVLDYDGTILDSMTMWGTTPARFAARLGKEVDDRFNDSIKYMSLEESAQIFREFGATGTDEEIVDQIMDMVFESYRDELPLKDGVTELLEDLSSHGIRMSIATQTPSRMILAANKRLGIDHYFEAVYSCGNGELTRRSLISTISLLQESELHRVRLWSSRIWSIQSSLSNPFLKPTVTVSSPILSINKALNVAINE